jgi:hypothetical protein
LSDRVWLDLYYLRLFKTTGAGARRTAVSRCRRLPRTTGRTGSTPTSMACPLCPGSE